MARQAGDELHASTETIGHPDPNENSDAGDAVALDADGNVVLADSEAGHELIGIRSRNRQTRDVASIHHDGATVAKVAGTVAAGDGLNIGNTTDGTVGVLDTEAGGPAVALSDEGGEYRGASIPAGHAAVLLR